MELRDYLRMLRRGWPAIVLITVLCAGIAALYAAALPKRYEAYTTLFVSATGSRTTEDLSAGYSFAANSVVTFGKLVSSEAVLAPVAADMRPQRDVNALTSAVTVAVPDETTLITITVADSDPQTAARLADAVAASAARVLPALQDSDVGAPRLELQQLRRAAVPTVPVSPDTKRILALGAIVGICVGLAVTIAAQTLDTRVRRPDDIRELSDIPVLAVIPQAKGTQKHGVPVRDDQAGSTGEAFRRLRTNVGFMEMLERRSLAFAAVEENRGSAQVPINLAWSLAQAGWRVLLVDLDLRRWEIGDALGMRRGAGVSDVLLGKADLASVVRESGEPRLRVALSGTTQTSPADLLTAPTMNKLLMRMEKDYDYVLLHAPPVLEYTDAAIVSRLAGGTFLTVAVGRTRSHEVTTALDILDNAQVKPFGMVLTGTRFLDGLASFFGNGFRRDQSADLESPIVLADPATESIRTMSRSRPAPRPRLTGLAANTSSPTVKTPAIGPQRGPWSPPDRPRADHGPAASPPAAPSSAGATPKPAPGPAPAPAPAPAGVEPRPKAAGAPSDDELVSSAPEAGRPRVDVPPLLPAGLSGPSPRIPTDPRS